jgi:CDP-glucose 4,6-dehydratase
MLTGHTGFKGTWMTFLLENLGVPVIGYSLPPEKDSLFHRSNRTGAIPEVFADIRDYNSLEKFIDEHKPSTIVHMAAQPLVLKSYETPRETFDVNVMGTVNVLDIAFKKGYIQTIVVVTTDKVYRNNYSGRAFVETDALEGNDPYSASKVGTESAVKAWQKISETSGGPIVISVRAGNVIGGGDWAENRLIPDLIRGFASSEQTLIRNPNSIRPWQHVLDPLCGYVLFLEAVLRNSKLRHCNFGPHEEQLTVLEVANLAAAEWGAIVPEFKNTSSNVDFLEAPILLLDSQKALSELAWMPRLSATQAISSSVQWWKAVLMDNANPFEMSMIEIKEYLSKLR